MVFHKDTRSLVCHHCGYTQRVPARCPGCGAADILPVGIGTQRIEEEIGKLWPDARRLRIDRDNFKTKRSTDKAFQDVHEGKVDILIGTQMIAKGHDFKKVSLVVILNIDSQLISTDVRARERAFATMMQVSGRAGRAGLKSEVLVETAFPDDEIFTFLAHQDYHHRMDPETPLEETMGALDQAVKSGKALYAGLSNYNGQKMQEAAAILRDLKCPFVINQNRYSIFDRTIENNGLKEAAVKEKKGLIAFSPLAQGTLTDRYLYGIPADSRVMTDGRFLKKDQLTEEKISQIRALNEMAGQRGEKLSQMALKWVMKDPVVTSVLIGASKPEQILDNLKMLDGAPLSEEELLKIDQICGIK